MKHIAIVMAMKQEIDALCSFLEKHGYTKTGGYNFRTSTAEIQVLRCGVLARNINVLEKKKDFLKKADGVLITGISGAVNPQHQVSKAIVPQNITLYDSVKPALDNQVAIFEQIEKICPALGNTVLCQNLATVDHFVDHREKKLLHGVDAVDMESYHIMEWMNENEIPAFCFRVIGDSFTQRLPRESSLVQFMRLSGAEKVRWVVRHPVEWVRCIRLMRSSVIALRRLSSCVGKWLEFIQTGTVSSSAVNRHEKGM
ncbi:MAG: hypothetical protein C4541_08275 [Candidatus Auribacter fodinae]|jgi:nucleoside phosphorylase|uniref:Nucleoside phosphorylase domain-containing protein n=1 Tax=Candidatus Auribacter fodinae TaxID=2093366 RepID=A0A3A4QZY4_9BACT|nr:MAG: hypothetical protein C4541_08275 [Candidatus Auribacter fodinae]